VKRLLPFFTAVLVVVTSCSSAATQDPGVEEPVDSVVEGGGVSLRVRSLGPAQAARTTVVVHGGPGLSADAMASYDALAGPDRRVVGWDQRASGRSSAPADTDLALGAHVADLEAVRSAIEADVIDLVGQSWGGAIAAAYAATHPDRVSSLVLVGAVPLDVDAFIAGQERFSERATLEQQAGTVPEPLPPATGGSCLEAFRAMLPVYLHDDDRADEVEVGTCSAPASASTYAAFVGDPEVDRFARLLAGDRGPALLVAGRHDAFGLEWVDRIAELLDGADVHRLIVDDAGHLVVAEAPGAVLDEIAAFTP
jgi:pimeloyl-ACP methyl ester carboxylesterase